MLEAEEPYAKYPWFFYEAAVGQERLLGCERKVMPTSLYKTKGDMKPWSSWCSAPMLYLKWRQLSVQVDVAPSWKSICWDSWESSCSTLTLNRPGYEAPPVVVKRIIEVPVQIFIYTALRGAVLQRELWDDPGQNQSSEVCLLNPDHLMRLPWQWCHWEKCVWYLTYRQIPNLFGKKSSTEKRRNWEERLGITGVKVLFFYRSRSLSRFVPEIDLQRVDLTRRQEMGSRGGIDSVAREKQAATLALATREIPMANCRLCAQELPKAHPNMDLLKYVSDFQPFSGLERRPRWLCVGTAMQAGLVIVTRKNPLSYYNFLPLEGNSSNRRNPEMEILGKLLSIKVRCW